MVFGWLSRHESKPRRLCVDAPTVSVAQSTRTRARSQAVAAGAIGIVVRGDHHHPRVCQESHRRVYVGGARRRGSNYFKNFDVVLSARTLPLVWQVGQ